MSQFSSPDPGDTSPLLTHSLPERFFRSSSLVRRPPPHLRSAARLLRRASSRHMMLREPSVMVRENAAEQLEERQNDWAYSKPIIVLDVLWNLAFVVIAAVVLGLSVGEVPEVPLRVWVVGYGLQCLFHVVCVGVEYRNRRRVVAGGFSGVEDGGAGNERVRSDGSGREIEEDELEEQGGRSRLCIMFLAFEVVFVVICVLIACLIGVAVCCCLPCIIAVLYAVTDQEGATKEDIDQLPKFKVHKLDDSSKVNGEIQESFQGMMIKCYMIAPLNAPFYGRCYFDKYKKEIMLLSVDRGHPDYTSFKPEKRHAEKVEPSGDHSASDSESQKKLVVAEIYKPSVHVNPIFRAVGADIGNLYSVSEATYVAFSYVE